MLGFSTNYCSYHRAVERSRSCSSYSTVELATCTSRDVVIADPSDPILTTCTGLVSGRVCAKMTPRTMRAASRFLLQLLVFRASGTTASAAAAHAKCTVVGAARLTQVWGLQRCGTNLLEGLIMKTFDAYSPWLTRMGSHFTNVGPSAVPLCRNVEQHWWV